MTSENANPVARAHAPADDEREALDYAIRCAIPTDLDYRPLWKLIRAIQDSVIAAGFLRPEVEEPSQEHVFGTAGAYRVCHTCGLADFQHEPQGKPSSEAEPSAEPTCEHGTPLSALCEYAAQYASGETAAPHPEHAEPQGEPSDEISRTKLISVISGTQSSDPFVIADRVLAALRAAGGAR